MLAYRGSPTTKFCNLGPSYDFDPSTSGDQDGLLKTGSSLLAHCFADFTGYFGNTTLQASVFDITGNLRAVTRSAAGAYTMMGGGFDSATEAGATCGATTFVAAPTFSASVSLPFFGGSDALSVLAAK